MVIDNSSGVMDLGFMSKLWVLGLMFEWVRLVGLGLGGDRFGLGGRRGLNVELVSESQGTLNFSFLFYVIIVHTYHTRRAVKRITACRADPFN